MTNPHTIPATCDLAIIGGGPAGSTIAKIVAESGYSVVLLEKDSHPRFHIGESLLPFNLKIFEMLGILDQVEKIGVYKPGVEFINDSEDFLRSELKFSDALNIDSTHDHAFQVKRSQLDHLLFQNAARSGACCIQDARVTRVVFSEDQPHTLELSHQTQSYTIKAKYVVDASGRDALIAKKNNLHVANRKHATAAVFGHFNNVPRNTGSSKGNISIYWFRHGWIWMIPLLGDIMSVGAVCNPEYMRKRSKDLMAFFYDTIAMNPHAKQRLANASPQSEITATGNYSYFSHTNQGNRWLLIGDANFFLDPVFSSGVYFAMHSAILGAEIVLSELEADKSKIKQSSRRYHQLNKRGIEELSWFIYRFNTPAMKDLFLFPDHKNRWQIKGAVIAVLAGDIYHNNRVKIRVRVFRFIYHMVRFRLWMQSFTGSKNNATTLED